MITVLLVDDQPLVRAGLRMVLESQADIEVVGEAWDGSEAIKLCTELRPDIVLMDVRMRCTNGIDATRSILASALRTKVLMLTTFDVDEYVLDALATGAIVSFAI